MNRSSSTASALSTALAFTTGLFLAGTVCAQKTKTSSSTHRVVVVNGEKVFDDKTVDGKSVKGVLDDLDLPGIDKSKLLKEVRERIEEAKKAARSSAKSSSRSTSTSGSKSTSSHRVVVVNGKTIVDDRTKDGSPLPGSIGSDIDVKALLRKVRAKVGGLEDCGDLGDLGDLDDFDMIECAEKERERRVDESAKVSRPAAKKTKAKTETKTALPPVNRWIKTPVKSEKRSAKPAKSPKSAQSPKSAKSSKPRRLRRRTEGSSSRTLR